MLEPGTVYVCPPGVHMTAEHSMRFTAAPKLPFVRPSADLMLESVGRTYGIACPRRGAAGPWHRWVDDHEIMLDGPLSAEHHGRSVDAIPRAGASAYVTKTRASGELVPALRAVMEARRT